jgi:aminoglycoside 6'-N-acetyltransferase
MPKPGDHRPAYQFRAFGTADLALVRQWLAMPHVAEWWGNPDEQYELVSSDLAEPAMAQFIVTFDDDPFAYLQCYDLRVWPTAAFGAQPGGARGIDQFVGRPDMIGRGHGSGFIRHFVDELILSGVPRVITDPDPENARAIRAYEKAGFTRGCILPTNDGPALLMTRDA